MCYCVYTCVYIYICVCFSVCMGVCVCVCVCVCVWKVDKRVWTSLRNPITTYVKLIAECKPTKIFFLTRVGLNACNTYTFMKLNFAYKNNRSCQHPQYI